MQWSPRNFFFSVVKWLAGILLFLILLLLMVWGALQTQWGQDKLKQYAVSYLQGKLRTKLSIGSIKINWLTHITIQDVYLEDLQKRPILQVKRLEVSYDISGILDKRIGIPVIELDGTRVALYRAPNDSNFNFSFIPAAFASSEPAPKDTSSPGYVILPGKISITRLGFLMDDQFGGQELDASLGSLQTEVDSFDLDKMVFHTRQVVTDSLRAAITFTKKTVAPPSVSTDENTETPFRFGSYSILLLNTDFRMNNTPDQFALVTSARTLQGKELQFDLQRMHASASSLQLLDHSSSISMVSGPDTIKAVAASPSDSQPFTFSVGKITIERNAVKFDDNAKAKACTGVFDPAHIGISDFTMQAAAINYNGKVYAADINGFSMAEQSGFRLLELHTRASYADTGVSLKQLVVKTAQNQISGDAQLSYASIGEMTSKPAATKVTLKLQKSRIQLDELLYFSPDLKKNKSFQPLLGKVFYLNTKVEGQLNKLHIPELVMTQERTKLLASADVYELPDTKKLRIDLRLKELSGYRKDLLGFLPKNTIPDSLLHYIPEQFKLTGNYKGTLDDLFADMQLKTSDGNIAVKGTLQQLSNPKELVYDLDISTDEIQLAKLLADTLFGNVSVQAKVKGHGTDLKTATAAVQAKVKQAYFQGYIYQDIDLDAKLEKNTVTATIDSRDPNIALHSETFYNMDQLHGSFKTETSIEHADLFKLGFMNDTLAVSGKLHADIPQLDSAQLNGEVLATALLLDFGHKQYRLDSIAVDAVYANDTQLIRLQSPYVDGTLKGKYSLQSLPVAAKTIANKYLYTTSIDTSFTNKISAKLEANVHIPDSLVNLIPGVKELSPFNVKALLDTDSSTLAFLTSINKLRYNDFVFDTIIIAALNMPSREEYKLMQYGIIVRQLTTPSFSLEQSAIKGTIRHGTINGQVELLDSARQPRYNIPYVIINDPVAPYIKLGDSLLVNKQHWTVNANNIVYFNTKALKGSNLVISRNEESVAIFADSVQSSGLPLTLNLKQFRLKNVADVFISDTSLLDGTANGTVTVPSFDPFQFISHLRIDSLKVKGVNAGELALEVKEEQANEMLIDISLLGSKNDVTIKGDYNAKETATNLQLNMNSFDLQTVQPFVQKYFGKLKGSLKGGISVKGDKTQTEILGKIRTDSVDLVYRDFGTELRIPDGEVNITEDRLEFNHFDFLDSAGNKGRLEGGVTVNSLTDYQIDAKLTTTRFRVIGRKKYTDQMMYGPANADANITLKGNQDLVNIEGSVKLIDSSQLTYIYSSDGAAGRGEGLIEFFDPLHPFDSVALVAKKKSVAAGPKFAINTYLNVTPTSKVTIVLDEYSGDQLTVQGTAALNFAMSAGGAMNLTGNYEVESGDYDLSLAQVIKKKFKIQKGSRITWTGDPLKADMDITAMYKVKTTAGELVNDIQGTPGIDKQKLNFEVYLMLTKELLKPEINFKLDMEEGDRSAFNGVVYNRIRQVNTIPSDLNKQVMGLLAINHFIADNPFSSLSSTGSSVETSVYATAGRLLTQELTDLVSNAVKGVDIEFDLDMNEDYSSGSAQRTTDLKMGVRKSLANNRLQVYVGSSFALEGQNQQENALSGLAGDVTLEYMLSKDGRYRIKGFRVNERELTFQGTVVKTGVTFVVVLEFNKFKNAFKKKKKTSN